MSEPPVTGIAEKIAPGTQRLLAPNPSPMTHWGTNTYIIGEQDCVVVDPGPDHPAHLDALLTATRGRRVAAVLVTHAHLDHTGAAHAFARACDAPLCAFGRGEVGRSPAMEHLAATGKVGGGEGMDRAFTPDRALADGDWVSLGPDRITALHTPGHFPGHLSFEFGDVLFSGDHIMGWSTTLISPPDGDLAAFYASCARLSDLSHRLYLPGHGAPVAEPRAVIEAQVSHRRARERQILDALARAPGTPNELAKRIYTEIDPRLLPAAARNVLAHLIELCERGAARANPELAWDARFHLL